MKTLEEIQQEVKKDLDIQEFELDSEALALVKKYDKYLCVFTECSVLLEELMIKNTKLKKYLWLFYQGKLKESEYIKYPHPNIKIVKSELDMFIYSDVRMVELKREINLVKTKMEYLERTMKQINNLGYLIRTSLDFSKFSSGLG